MIDYRHLATLPEAELRLFDLAVVNLACAVDLPGSERVDVSACAQALDQWAGVAQRWTNAALLEYVGPNATEPEIAAFRLIALHTALHRHCGVRYHPDKIGILEDARFELDDMCVSAVTHGAGGTCATLPVVYAAVGRRLGYPLHLGLAKSHVFCRWDDPAAGIRLNLDGGSTPTLRSDDYYRRWPVPMGRAEEEQFGYLRSLSPREELALFIASRGWVWESIGEYGRAVDEFAAAAELDDPWPRYPSCIRRTVEAWARHTGPRNQERPQLLAHTDRRWPGMPWELEAEIMSLEEQGRPSKVDIPANSWDGSQIRRALGL